MAQPLWLVSLIKKTFGRRFIVAKLTKVPVVGTLLDHWLFAGDDIIYLPRDRVIRVNQPVSMPDEIVLPSQIVEHFVAKANYHWIMNTCICRDATRCKDYPIDLGCLFLGKAALGINPKLGRRITREKALEHLRRCREAGLVHLIGRNKLDTVWLGVSPGERLLTICNCCPCCCLWRVLPHIAPQIGVKISKMPSVAVTVNNRCTGCRVCAEDVCFVNAVHLVNDRAVIGDACGVAVVV